MGSETAVASRVFETGGVGLLTGVCVLRYEHGVENLLPIFADRRIGVEGRFRTGRVREPRRSG